ncbi:MAG: glycerate kinase [Micropruina sp.]|nr:glycerate kinase [Micropruina sp.]
MRIVVASGPVGPLSAREASVAIARGFPSAHVAVVPMAERGEAFAAALEGLLGAVLAADPDGWELVGDATIGVGLHAGQAAAGIDVHASSADLGLRVVDLLSRARAPRLVVDLTSNTAHDGGAGFLSALGARANVSLDEGLHGLDGVGEVDLAEAHRRLAGCELIGVIDHESSEDQLLGLRGVTVRRGFDAGLERHLLTTLDARLEAFAAACGDSGRVPGSGAGRGLGHGVLALGGRLVTAPGLIAELVGLERSLAVADLLVTACDDFDIGNRGGTLVADLTRRAEAALVPLLVLARRVHLSGREMRTFGVEAAHVITELTGDPETDLTATARRVGMGWDG